MAALVVEHVFQFYLQKGAPLPVAISVRTDLGRILLKPFKYVFNKDPCSLGAL